MDESFDSVEFWCFGKNLGRLNILFLIDCIAKLMDALVGFSSATM